MKQRRFKCNRLVIEKQFNYYIFETMRLCSDLKGLDYSTKESFLNDMAWIFKSLGNLKQYLNKCNNNSNAGICSPVTDKISVGSCYFEPCIAEIKEILKEIPHALKYHRIICMGLKKEEE